MSFPRELYDLQASQLLALLDIYHVRTQDGQRYYGDNSIQSILAFISNWLSLPSDMIIPIQEEEYFSRQALSPEFLNKSEQNFFLTYGYGKPNNHISLTDAEFRSFYSNANPTALIALSDILSVCATRQNPDIIREALGEINLKSIDKYHQGAVKVITNCLDSSNNKLECFKEFLLSIGALPVFDYDPYHNVYISNISQLNEYTKVQINKSWNFEEIRNMPDLIVETYIRTLSDTEILKISVNLQSSQIIKYQDTLDLSILKNRLRSNLVDGAIKFLTKFDYYPYGNIIYYGRLVDDNMKIMTFNELKNSIDKYGALIDPYGNAIDYNTKIAKDNFKEYVSKTRVYEMQNKNFTNNKLRAIFESSEDLDADLEGDARKLILWSKGYPVAMNFDEYFKLWSPLFTDIIKDTVEYYKSIL